MRGVVVAVIAAGALCVLGLAAHAEADGAAASLEQQAVAAAGAGDRRAALAAWREAASGPPGSP